MLLRLLCFINKNIQRLISYIKYNFESEKFISKESREILIMSSILFIFITLFGVIFAKYI